MKQQIIPLENNVFDIDCTSNPGGNIPYILENYPGIIYESSHCTNDCGKIKRIMQKFYIDPPDLLDKNVFENIISKEVFINHNVECDTKGCNGLRMYTIPGMGN